MSNSILLQWPFVLILKASFWRIENYVVQFVCARKHCLPAPNMYCDNWLIRNARPLTCQHHIHNMPWTYVKLSTSVLCATYNLCIRLFLFPYVQYGIHNVNNSLYNVSMFLTVQNKLNTISTHSFTNIP